MVQKLALCFDFDGTLCPGNMQEYGLLQDLGYKNPKQFDAFWQSRIELSRLTGADPVHAYLYLICKEAKAKGIRIDAGTLRKYGESISFFPGVTNFIPYIKQKAAMCGLETDAFVISSGINDIVLGSQIARHLKEVYACELIYGDMPWPTKTVDGDAKTKIIECLYNGKQDRDPWIESTEKSHCYKHIIYFGDSYGDQACMSLVRKLGGLSIAVHGGDDTVAKSLRNSGAAEYSVPADYRPGGEISKLVGYYLQTIGIQSVFKKSRQRYMRPIYNALPAI